MAKIRNIMAAIYCRLSRDDGGDSESNSIGNQREQLTRYALEHGFAVYGEYVDDGVSGTTFERPSFKRMITDIEDGKIGIVLCKDLSRLGRNNALVAYYTEIFFINHNVRLICVNDSIDTSIGDNDIMPFKSVINEYYAKDISKKIRSARRTQALRGDFYGSLAPYGYIKNPENRHKLIVDSEAAEIVKQMFQMAADGHGVCYIRRTLYNARILIPSAYRLYIHGLKGGIVDENCPYDWSVSAIRGILANRVYVGDIVNHRQSTKSFKNRHYVRHPESEQIIVANMHESIVEQDLFERVQQIMKIKRRDHPRKTPNIFAGLLVCADCGSHLTFHASERSIDKAGTFVCNKYRHNSRHAADSKCTIHSVAYKTLYDLALQQLNALLAANLTEEGVLRKIEEKRAANADAKRNFDNQKNRDKLKQRDQELRLIIRNILEKNALGEISQATFADLYGGYNAEQEAIATKLKVLEANEIAVENDRINTKRFAEILQKYTAAKELSREILLDLIEKIVVHEATGDYQHRNRQQVIEFHYRFVGNLRGEELLIV